MATSFYFLKTFCSTTEQGVTNVLRQVLLFVQINHSDNLCVNELANMNIAQKMKFPIKDFFSKCDQIRRKLRIWSHLLKKSLMENFIFCAVFTILIIGTTEKQQSEGVLKMLLNSSKFVKFVKIHLKTPVPVPF